MKRLAYQKLLDWKENLARKPLILQGARQVGKTWLVKQFATQEYKKLVYINFEQNQEIHLLFEGNLNPKRIVFELELYYGSKINTQETLIFFDEIQACQKALTSLKYFQEDNESYHIIAAGSLLGVSIGKTSSFPVGKVNFLPVYPMNFFEFLMAADEGILVDFLWQKNDFQNIPEAIHEKLNKYLKIYLFVGGMPEAIQTYIDTKDMAEVRKVQNEILWAYENDFSKYTTKAQSVKNKELWDSLPAQISKEKKKFKYSDIKKGARTSMYEQSIEWLKQAGVIHVSYQLSTPKLPLNGHYDTAKFKIYLLDTGLLGAKMNLSASIIIDPDKLFIEFNGAFVESFAAAEIAQNNHTNLCYWTSEGVAEVDFIYQFKDQLYPIEIKSGTSKTMTSLRLYHDKFQPPYILRASPRNFYVKNEFVNIPLYALNQLEKYLNLLSLPKP